MTADPKQQCPEPPRRHDKYDQILAVAQSVPRLKVAVAHPCDPSSLGAVFEAAGLGLIEPILDGPQGTITSFAQALGKDLSAVRIVEAAHSHAAADVTRAMASHALDA
jgi:phosphate acetyltransferase